MALYNSRSTHLSLTEINGVVHDGYTLAHVHAHVHADGDLVPDDYERVRDGYVADVRDCHHDDGAHDGHVHCGCVLDGRVAGDRARADYVHDDRSHGDYALDD